jgi:hypothetical protein
MTDARKLWTSGSKVPVQVDAKEIAAQAERFARRMFWANGKEYIAGAIVIPVFVAYAALPQVGLPLLSRIASGLTVVAAIFVLAHLWRRGGGGAADLRWGDTTLSAYRRQLERRRELLRDVPRWYLAPFLPGLVLFHIGTALGPRPGAWRGSAISGAVSIAVFIAIAILNRRGARKLDAEIAALPPDEPT